MEGNKLELKHLAAYLPYELKIKYLHTELYNFIAPLVHSRTSNNMRDGVTLSEALYEDTFKPLLFPLSEFGDSDDLRKLHEFIGFGRWCEAYDHYFDAWFNDACSIGKLVLQSPYEVMQYFFSNHFDVFNLIPKNLAIDINTLKQ